MKQIESTKLNEISVGMLLGYSIPEGPRRFGIVTNINAVDRHIELVEFEPMASDGPATRHRRLTVA